MGPSALCANPGKTLSKAVVFKEGTSSMAFSLRALPFLMDLRFHKMGLSKAGLLSSGHLCCCPFLLLALIFNTNYS